MPFGNDARSVRRGLPTQARPAFGTAATSSPVSTTGSRFGLRARTTPSIRFSGFSSTCSERNSNAAKSLVLGRRGQINEQAALGSAGSGRR